MVKLIVAVDGPDGIYGTTDDFNADAIVLSLGTSSPYIYTSYCDDMPPDLTDAINYANSKNIAFVSADPDYSLNQIKTVITSTPLDLGAKGFDSIYGY